MAMISSSSPPPPVSSSSPSSSFSSSSSSSSSSPRRRPRVLLALTGSVASIKAQALIDELQRFSRVRVLHSKRAAEFFRAEELRFQESPPASPSSSSSSSSPAYSSAYSPTSSSSSLPSSASSSSAPYTLSESQRVFSDADEWPSSSSSSSSSLWHRDDAIAHIALRDWADALVIAPLSAHSMACIAHGLADGLVLCVARAWRFEAEEQVEEERRTEEEEEEGEHAVDSQASSSNSSSSSTAIPLSSSFSPAHSSNAKLKLKPFILAPAMNTSMWHHPLTARQLALIQSFGRNVLIVPPISKRLACGDFGMGAMQEPAVIAQRVREALEMR